MEPSHVRYGVLILVLMEDALRQLVTKFVKQFQYVLILVLMEDALRHDKQLAAAELLMRS